MNDERQEKTYPNSNPEASGIEDILEALNDLDSSEATSDSTANDARMDLIRQTRDGLKADAIKNGWKAQACREIDEHRQADGRAAYNAKRRADYARAMLDEIGRLPRPYGKSDGPEKQDKRRKQGSGRQAAFRAAMTDEQKAAANKARSERRRKQRERKQAEATAALTDRAIF
jgi:hypothetical protein